MRNTYPNGLERTARIDAGRKLFKDVIKIIIVFMMVWMTAKTFYKIGYNEGRIETLQAIEVQNAI